MTPLESEAVLMVPITLDQEWARMTEYYSACSVTINKLINKFIAQEKTIQYFQ